MLNSVLTRRNASVKTKLTVKSVVAVSLVVLAVALPQFFHLIGGASAGIRWLPMYLPVLIAGCLLGWKWGLGVAVMSPLMSYFITSAFGDPMPALARLPFMIAELAVFALVSGIFGDKLLDKKFLAFPAVIGACVAGRTVFIILVALFGSNLGLTVGTVWAQIQTGLVGLLLQIVLVPLIVIGLSFLMKRKEGKNK